MTLSLQPRAFIFDLDGTLLDSAPDITRALNAVLSSRGIPNVPREQVAQWVGTGSRQLIIAALRHAGREADDGSVLSLLRDYSEAYSAAPIVHSQLYPNALFTLQALSARPSCQLALVTNKLSVVTGKLLTALDIERYFATWIGGDDVARPKPDPEGLLTCCQRLGVGPADALFVGDSQHDVRAARNAGMPVIAVRYGYNHGVPIEQAHPDAVIDSLSELL